MTLNSALLKFPGQKAEEAPIIARFFCGFECSRETFSLFGGGFAKVGSEGCRAECGDLPSGFYRFRNWGRSQGAKVP